MLNYQSVTSGQQISVPYIGEWSAAVPVRCFCGPFWGFLMCLASKTWLAVGIPPPLAETSGGFFYLGPPGSIKISSIWWFGFPEKHYQCDILGGNIPGDWLIASPKNLAWKTPHVPSPVTLLAGTYRHQTWHWRTTTLLDFGDPGHVP